jgi:hypothetical protein
VDAVGEGRAATGGVAAGGVAEAACGTGGGLRAAGAVCGFTVTLAGWRGCVVVAGSAVAGVVVAVSGDVAAVAGGGLGCCTLSLIFVSCILVHAYWAGRSAMSL